MGDYDDLIAAAGAPPSAPANASAAPPAAGGEYDDLVAAAGAAPAAAPATAPAPKPPTNERDRGFLDAITRNVGNGADLGFGPTVDAGITTALSKVPWLRDMAAKVPAIDPSVANPNITYDQRRAAAANALKDTQKYHPVASTFGEMAGNTLATLAAPESEALAAASPLVRGTVVGGGLGYTQGVGDAVSSGKSLPEALTEGGKSAIAGGLTGGALEGTMGRILSKATENADNWIVKDIAGHDRATSATATNNKKLANDATDVRRLIKSDPGLEKADAAAAAGDMAKLQGFQDTIKDRLATELSPRKANYATVEAAKPVRFGDLDNSLKEEIKALPASDEVVKNALEHQRVLLREHWASKAIPEQTSYTLDPEKEIAPGFTAGEALKNYQGVLAKAKTPESVAQAQSAIDTLHKEFGEPKTVPASTAYDPNTTVPILTLRQHVSALQKATANTMGALNEHERYNAVKQVERPFKQFLDNHLDEVAKASPEAETAVNDIRKSNDRVSALLNMQKVVDNRIQKAQTNAMAGMRPAFGIRGAIHQAVGPGLPGVAAAALLGHPAVAAGLAMTTVAPTVKRSADKALAALLRHAASGSATAQIVEAAIREGVPRALALRIASSAATGAVNNIATNIGNKI
jgi:hypothetical protein